MVAGGEAAALVHGVLHASDSGLGLTEVPTGDLTSLWLVVHIYMLLTVGLVRRSCRKCGIHAG